MKFSPLKKKLAAVLLFLIVSSLLLALWAFVLEPNSLTVKHESLALERWPAGLSGLKIALIGDFHTGAPFIDEAKLRRIVAETNAQQPDLILLAGDFVVGSEWGAHYVPPQTIADNLQGLRARLGVYAVLGNHDWWKDGPGVREALEKRGIRVLENEAARLEDRGQAFWLVGLGDYWTSRPDYRKALAQVTDDAPALALTHNPDLFPEEPDRFALTLAAHTHGGQVALPFIGRRVVPSRYRQRYAIGHIVENGRHLYVTPGIGTSVFPVRFRVPPEITVLTLAAKP